MEIKERSRIGLTRARGASDSLIKSVGYIGEIDTATMGSIVPAFGSAYIQNKQRDQ
jgi:hypothetical protein